MKFKIPMIKQTLNRPKKGINKAAVIKAPNAEPIESAPYVPDAIS